jgi:uncharacterized protein YggT (Ycf19 family)
MKNFWLYIFLVIVIIYYLQFNNNSYENFTPFMRQIYRPHLRNVRITVENFYSKHKNNATILLRKYNIL